MCWWLNLDECSFEFGEESAAQRILSSIKVGVGFSHAFVSVAKKDSQDINDSDRDNLAALIQSSKYE